MTQSRGDMSAPVTQPPWKVLLVDDEPAIHQVTQMAMNGFEFEQRPLQFLNAFSAAEACALLAEHPDTALVLLDMVMEHDLAGIDVIRCLRDTLKNSRTRIVLRTGHPGCAPEAALVGEYDIHDYREKTELTRTRLFTLFFSALRAYRDTGTNRSAASVETDAPAREPQTDTEHSVHPPDSAADVIPERPHPAVFQPDSGETGPDSISLFSRLVSGLPHEVKTPLSISFSSLQLLQDQLQQLQADESTAQSEPLQQFLCSAAQTLELSLSHLQRTRVLVDDFAAVAAGRSPAVQEPFSLQTVLADTLKGLHYELQARSVQVCVQCPDDLVLHSDAGALIQVLSNLIINSLQHGFSPDGDDHQIEIRVSEQPAELVLLYQDNGAGIDPEIAPNIFDPFFTTRQGEGGTGIGLAIVRELTERRLNGRISLLASGQGCCFRLRLPRPAA